MNPNQVQAQQPAQLPFPEAEYNLLVEQAHKPVFLQKLARDWGVVPANEVEEQQLLEMAGVLRRAESQESIKQASAGNTLISAASDYLKTAATAQGYPQQPTTRDRLIEKAASEAVNNNPELAAAALRFGEYIAQFDQ